MSELAECPLCKGGRVRRVANYSICSVCCGSKSIPVAMAVELELTGALDFNEDRASLTGWANYLTEIRKRYAVA